MGVSTTPPSSRRSTRRGSGAPFSGKVRSGAVVVEEVVAQQATQVDLVEHDHMVEALAAQGSDEAFHVRILPWGPGGRLDLADSHGLGSARERDAVHRIAVAQHVARGGIPGEGLYELLGRHWAVGVSVTLVNDASPIVREDHEDEQTLNITVGTTKKSTETRVCMLSRNVRQVCDGGPLRRPRYFDTAACEISTPSF